MSKYGFKRRAGRIQTHSVTWSPIFYFILEAMKAKEEESGIESYSLTESKPVLNIRK